MEETFEWIEYSNQLFDLEEIYKNELHEEYSNIYRNPLCESLKFEQTKQFFKKCTKNIFQEFQKEEFEEETQKEFINPLFIYDSSYLFQRGYCKDEEVFFQITLG
jgi:lysyl-tRNA synthetase class II